MAKSVLNKSKTVDFTKQPMFFGEDLQIQRYDTMKYPIFDKLTQQQLGYFWRPEEVSLQKDRNDYLDLREEQKFIFTSNLKYQTMLDSVQGRGPCLAFLPFVSLPELEGAIVAWDFMETIHSRSYTYIIKNLYSQPGEIFDTIIKDEKIEKRANSVTKTYDDLIKMGYQWTLDKSKVDMYELKKKLYEIYFSNLEENLHLLLINQKEFLNDLFQKTNFCLTMQFSPKFFELEQSNEINEDFRQNFEEAIFDPLEKFIEEEILKSKKKAKNFYKSNYFFS